jgi:hypothetical protein
MIRSGSSGSTRHQGPACRRPEISMPHFYSTKPPHVGELIGRTVLQFTGVQQHGTVGIGGQTVEQQAVLVS